VSRVASDRGGVKVRRASSWTEAVFHVLAHVDARGLAASCFDPICVAWARDRLGPIAGRALAEDVEVLRRSATSHDVLARAQALAWVFTSREESERAVDRPLASLTASDVASDEALAIASSAGPLAEVLRAAAELEAEALGAIDVDLSDDDLRAITAALDEVSRAAPSLASCEVALARPLGLRGRMLGASIVVGVPHIACPDPEHLAWQAAHEATVSAIAGRSFVETERRAIGLLRSRARDVGLGDAHARWLGRLDLRALGPIPDVDDSPE